MEWSNKILYFWILNVNIIVFNDQVEHKYNIPKSLEGKLNYTLILWLILAFDLCADWYFQTA